MGPKRSHGVDGVGVAVCDFFINSVLDCASRLALRIVSYIDRLLLIRN
jgi:hypothetical protein